MSKPQKYAPWLYPPIKALVRLFYPKITVYGEENLPQEPCLVVGNHSQMNGPIACELYFPGKHYTWCAGQMMRKEEVAEYAFQDFWSQKPKWTQPFYKFLSHIIVPFSVCIFNNANTIGVYRDSRIISSFKTTLKRLSEGANVVVFPEHNTPYNTILSEFETRFVDIAQLYHKRQGKTLPFVPLYIAPNLKSMYIGKPIYFNPDAPIEEERQRICRFLMEEITAQAVSLPRHIVVPYRNIPKKHYPWNREDSL